MRLIERLRKEACEKETRIGLDKLEKIIEEEFERLMIKHGLIAEVK